MPDFTIQDILTPVFDHSAAILEIAKALEDGGVTFEINPWSIKAKGFHPVSGDKFVINQNLSSSASSLAKNQVSPLAMGQTRYSLRGFLLQVWDTIFPGAAPPEILAILNKLNPDAPLFAESGFSLVLHTVGASPLATVKTIRQITGCTLYEANEAINHLPALILANESSQVVDFATAAFTAIEAQTAIYGHHAATDPKFSHPVMSPKALPIDQWAHAVISPVAPKPEVSLDEIVANDPLVKANPGFVLDADTAKALKPVPLAKAINLGQPVNGTDKASRYYVIGVGERVNVAARIRVADNSISLRAEARDGQKLTATEKANLNNILSEKAGYWSLHANFDTVSPARIVGAFLLGSGIDWTSQVTKEKELVMD